MRAVAGLCLLMLAACGSSLPQARHTHTGAAGPDEIARLRSAPGLTAEQAARLKAGEQQALRQQLDFAVLVQSSTAPYVGVGFVKGRTMGYAVARDGAGGLFPDGTARVPLEQIAPRLDRVMPAGAHGRHVLGVSPNGTMMAWNPDNMSQQVVLRPQNSTFGQVHLFDAQPILGANSVATAVQGNRLEIWSLASGNRQASSEVPGGQPRVIARGSVAGAVVYGTDTGEVRIWRRGGGADLLHAHGGPVLDLEVDRKGGRILSAAKDGTVHLWSRQGEMRQVAAFGHAARRVLADPGGDFMLAVPAKGAPRLIHMPSGKGVALNVGPSGRAEDPVFLPGGRGLLMRLGVDGLAHWPLALRGVPRIFAPKVEPGKGVVSFDMATAQDVLILATGAGRVEYWSLTRKVYLGTALVAPGGIDRVAVDPSGRRVIVSLANREVVGFDLDPAQAQPIWIGAADED